MSRSPSDPALSTVIARNAMFTVVGRLVFIVSWAVITPYMLRVLGVERFAIWALFFALSAYFTTFDLGLSQALIKFVSQFTAARDPHSLRGVVTLATVVYLGLTAPVVAALSVFQGPILDLIHTPAAIRTEAGRTLVGMALVLGINNFVGVMTAVLAGRQRMDVTNRIQLLVTAIQVGGAVTLLALGFGLQGLVAAYGLGVAVMGILSWFAMRSIAPEARLEFSAMSRPLFRKLFHFSAALQITNLGTFFQFQLDKFLLAHFATLAIVAHFELANRLSLAAWAVPLLMLPPLVPAASELTSQSDAERVVRLYRRASRYLLAASFPLGAFTITLAPHLATAWLGPGYPDVGRIAAVMVGFLVVITATGVGTAITRGMGEPWIEARYHLVGLTTHGILSLVLIPRLGVTGALLAIAISGVVSTFYFVARFHARLGESTGRWLAAQVLKPVVTSAVASGVVLAITGAWLRPTTGRLESWKAIGEGALVFAVAVAVLYPATRYFTREDVQELLRTVRRAPART